MNKKKGKVNRPKGKNLVDYRDLERNVLNEISEELRNKSKQTGK